jgi:hypothetical protein
MVPSREDIIRIEENLRRGLYYITPIREDMKRNKARI